MALSYQRLSISEAPFARAPKPGISLAKGNFLRAQAARFSIGRQCCGRWSERRRPFSSTGGRDDFRNSSASSFALTPGAAPPQAPPPFLPSLLAGVTESWHFVHLLFFWREISKAMFLSFCHLWCAMAPMERALSTIEAFSRLVGRGRPADPSTFAVALSGKRARENRKMDLSLSLSAHIRVVSGGRHSTLMRRPRP